MLPWSLPASLYRCGFNWIDGKMHCLVDTPATEIRVLTRPDYTGEKPKFSGREGGGFEYGTRVSPNFRIQLNVIRCRIEEHVRETILSWQTLVWIKKSWYRGGWFSSAACTQLADPKFTNLPKWVSKIKSKIWYVQDYGASENHTRLLSYLSYFSYLSYKANRGRLSRGFLTFFEKPRKSSNLKNVKRRVKSKSVGNNTEIPIFHSYSWTPELIAHSQVISGFLPRCFQQAASDSNRGFFFSHSFPSL